jgi:argininosuccinate lyase
VRQAEDAGIEMTALPAEAFATAHALVGSDARDALGAEASLAARNIAGGTGPVAVAAQIEQARASLTTAPRAIGSAT